MSSRLRGPSSPDIKLRLGSILVRLEQAVQQTRTSELRARQQFIAWHAQWATRKDQIAKRLTLIDSELNRIAAQTPSQPQLLVMDSHS